MNKLAIPLGVVWLVFSVILGLVLVMTPDTQKPLVKNSISNRAATTVTSGKNKPAAVKDQNPNNTVKTKAFVAGTSDEVTSVSAKVK